MEYQILAISGKEFAVYQGDRYELNKLPLPEGVPGTIDEILGAEHTGKYTSAGAYGAGGGPFYHGQGSKKDDVKQDLENFYRQVDKIVYEEFSKAFKLPLFFANLKERHSLYRGVAKNLYLADEVGFDDLIDDLGEMVVRQKGRLLVLSNEDMPVDTGIAAIYRY